MATTVGAVTMTIRSMPDSFDPLLDAWATPVGKIAAILIGVGVIWRQGIRPAWRGVKAARHRFHDVATIAEAISAEFRPNGGSTLRDSIDRLERKTERMEGQLNDLATEVAARNPAARTRTTDQQETS
jgi:hypothetical protein